MVNRENIDIVEDGVRRYEEWRDRLLSTPEDRVLYEREAAMSDLWLQLVETRQDLGLTQKQMAERMGVSVAQVARIEKRHYDGYTLKTLRRYVEALGDDFVLEMKIRRANQEQPNGLNSHKQ